MNGKIQTKIGFADHYGTTILPARAYRPRDKALVESAVKIIYTKIYAPINRATHHSLKELNTAIWEALETHNSQLLKDVTTASGYSLKR